MTTRNEAISKHIAAAIMRNTRKRYSSLLEDALESSNHMNSTVSNVNGTGNNETIKKFIGRDPIATDNPTLIGNKFGQTTQREAASDNINSHMSLTSQVGPIVIRPVDRRTIEGSTPGDFRANPGDVAAASLAVAADNGGPRSPMRGNRNARSYDELNNPRFKSTNSSRDSDAGNS